MRRFILLFLASLGLTGCISTTHGRIIMLQKGIVATVINECTPKAAVGSSSQGILLGELNFGDAKEIPVVPMFGSGERSATLYFRGYDATGKLIGTVSRTFSYDYNGTYSLVWKIGSRNQGSQWPGAQDVLVDGRGRNICAL